MTESAPKDQPALSREEIAEQRGRRFAGALEALEAELDWPLLERVYCEVDPAIPADQLVGFFGPEAREAQVDAGLRFGADLVERLKQGGASLYVGGGVAELVPMVAECVLLRRSVRLVTLPGPEADELERAFTAAGKREGLRLVRVDTAPLGQKPLEPVDHLWFASVLTDPEAFPALSDTLYERGHPKGRALSRETQVAEALLAAALGPLSERGWLTTSDEELPLWERALAARGLEARIPDTGRLSPIVGDVLRHISLAPNLHGTPSRGMLSHKAPQKGPPRRSQKRPPPSRS